MCICIENLLHKSSVLETLQITFQVNSKCYKRTGTSLKSTSCILEPVLCDFLAGVIIRLFWPGQDPADTLNPKKASHHPDKAHISLQAAGRTETQTNTRGFIILKKRAALHRQQSAHSPSSLTQAMHAHCWQHRTTCVHTLNMLTRTHTRSFTHTHTHLKRMRYFPNFLSISFDIYASFQ